MQAMMVINKASNRIINSLKKEVDIAPLVVFRLLFASIMLISIIRFISYNWIEELYINASYHFNFIGFEFVKFPGELGIYILFSILIISLLFILFGYYYHISMAIFFIVFTYIELIEKSLYLNHYYFISVCSFLLIFLPLSGHFSLDEKIRKKSYTIVNNWHILTIKVLISIVYFYAGIAKLNYDWLFEAMPLKLWLPYNSHILLVGKYLEYEITAYIFSWFGALYDLTIWAFLFWDKTRRYAYFFVIVFHLSTAILFQIGMFPYIMTLLPLIFFSEQIHIKILNKIKSYFNYATKNISTKLPNIFNNKIFISIIMLFFTFQFLFPLRSKFYTNDIFWTEQGYRFSWRVMLVEKTGWVNYKLIDKENNIIKNIDPIYELIDVQVKQMAFQPDMIIQYAKHLAEIHYKNYGTMPEVYVNSYVSINGSGSKKYFKSDINLVKADYNNISDYLEER